MGRIERIVERAKADAAREREIRERAAQQDRDELAARRAKKRGQ